MQGTSRVEHFKETWCSEWINKGLTSLLLLGKVPSSSPRCSTTERITFTMWNTGKTSHALGTQICSTIFTLKHSSRRAVIRIVRFAYQRHFCSTLIIVVLSGCMFKSPSGWLSRERDLPKFLKSYRVESNPPTRGLSREPDSRKFLKSYRVERNPPTRGLSCSPVLA